MSSAYDQLANQDLIDKTIKNLAANNMIAIVVDSSEEAKT